MNKNTLDDLFKNLENDFDIETPDAGHESRFLEKLHKKKGTVQITHSKKTVWKPFIGIAASILLLVTLAIGIQRGNESRDLASVSPKMEETQHFFTLTINEELNKLKAAATPETKKLIEDALKQIEILENDYTKLKVDLTKSNDDNRVIYAMISNFQNRIDILQNTLKQIETVKQLKITSHETSTTI